MPWVLAGTEPNQVSEQTASGHCPQMLLCRKETQPYLPHAYYRPHCQEMDYRVIVLEGAHRSDLARASHVVTSMSD